MELQPLNLFQPEADISSTVDTDEDTTQKRKRKKSEITEEFLVVEDVVLPEPEPQPEPEVAPRTYYHAEVRSTTRQNRFPKRGQKSAKNVRP